MIRFNSLAMATLSLVVLALALAALIAGEWTVAAFESGLSALGASPSRLATVAGVAATLAALVLLLEARHGRRAVFRSRLDGAAVEYAAEVVARAVERELASVEGIRDAHLQVTGGGQKADVRAQLRAEPWCDPQEVTARAGKRIHERLGKLQLRVGRMELSVQAAPYRRPTQGKPQQQQQPVGAESSASSS